MQRIEFARSTVCYEKGVIANWDNADTNCDNQFRARICSLQQWRAIVCRAGVQNPGRSWTSETSGAAAFTTIAGCTGDSLSSNFYTTQGIIGPCCLEYMKY